MKHLLVILTLLLWVGNISAEHLDLDQLLKKVKQTQGNEGRINREREARFLKEKNLQQQKLQQVSSALTAKQAKIDALKKTLDDNELQLTALETQLHEKSGILGELFGVARQAAGDLKADINSSLVSAQFPSRGEKLSAVAKSKELPTIQQLESLWFLLQQEMTEAGKVVKYTGKVMASSESQETDAEITRIGLFNAIANGKYLRYIPETGRLLHLPRQPSDRYLDLTEGLQNTDADFVTLALDPTRGAILNMLVHAPNARERIDQGGAIGYIIILLGVAGVLLVIYRMSVMIGVQSRVKRQLLQLDSPSDDNPLGRVLKSAQSHHTEDSDSLELMVDEAVTRELPLLERGLSTVKLLAAVAPLLGLLGTVVGMIATFQSISLFGTGDPKLMASGISQALVTTMLGLVVAIPLLFLHSLIAAQSRSLIQVLDEQSAGLLAQVLEKQDT